MFPEFTTCVNISRNTTTRQQTSDQTTNKQDDNSHNWHIRSINISQRCESQLTLQNYVPIFQ